VKSRIVADQKGGLGGFGKLVQQAQDLARGGEIEPLGIFDGNLGLERRGGQLPGLARAARCRAEHDIGDELLPAQIAPHGRGCLAAAAGQAAIEIGGGRIGAVGFGVT
jgi:hypothetical protein